LNETGRLERPGHSSFHISAALDKVRGKAITRLRRLAVGGTTHKDASMKNKAMVTAMLLGMFLGAFAIGFSHPSSAQNAVGGATKPKQSAVGGAATPGPVIGGAAKHGSVGSVPKPAPVVGGVTKQSSVGGTPTPGSTGSAVAPGSTAGMAKQTPPIAPPNKGGTVVTATKCAAGSCVAKGTKP
jgi:hypothetical protein